MKKEGTKKRKLFNKESSSNIIKEYDFKVTLIGDMSVGKTSIIKKYFDNEFNQQYKCTIGVDFRVKEMFTNDNEKIKIKIWDTCGQEQYRGITIQYYKNTHGIILVYDITSSKSFKCLEEWLKDIKENVDENIIIILIGNKADLKTKRQVDYIEAQKFADDNNIRFLGETSAKSGLNISYIFEEIANKLIEVKLQIENQNKMNEENKKLENDSFNYQNDNKNSKCC